MALVAGLHVDEILKFGTLPFPPLACRVPVPNAEAWAAACAVEALPAGLRCRVLPDASYVVNGFAADHKARLCLAGGQHTASWRKLYKALDDRTETVEVVRVLQRTAQRSKSLTASSRCAIFSAKCWLTVRRRPEL